MNKGVLYIVYTTTLFSLFLLTGCFSNTATLIIEGDGRIIETETNSTSINCSRDCTVSLNPDGRLVLTAEPDSGSQFSHWEGVCRHTMPTCTIRKGLNVLVTAVFVKDITLQSPSQTTSNYLHRSTFEQITAVKNNELSCTDLVSAYLYQIQTIDDGIENFNAMLSVNENALQEATAIDSRDASLYPLHCAVIAIKDNIDVADMPNTAGSLAMQYNLVSADAPLITKLRESGAIIIGKTNLSEWAGFRAGFTFINGWSSIAGQTKNALDPDYTPGGSSAGSAVAVANKIVSAAIGTSTTGSIIFPASVNGIVGFRPTTGVISRSGIIPLASSFDTAGPMTRTVRDAALLMELMAGEDNNDDITAKIPDDFNFSFLATLDEHSLQGLRVGYDATLLDKLPANKSALFNRQLEKLTNAGAILVAYDAPAVNLLQQWQFYAGIYRVFETEFKVGINDYLSKMASPNVPSTLEEIIAFNSDHADVVMPFFGQGRLINSQQTTGLTNPDYLQTLSNTKKIAGENFLNTIFRNNNLDIIVAPSTMPAYPINYVSGDPFDSEAVKLVIYAAIAGVPHLTMPMGTVEGLPVGISLIGHRYKDAQVLSYGYALERMQDD